jgi:hypothetical protein
MEEMKNGYDHSEDTGADGRTILKWTVINSCEGVDWVQLLQNRVQWREIMNTVMNFDQVSDC